MDSSLALLWAFQSSVKMLLKHFTYRHDLGYLLGKIHLVEQVLRQTNGDMGSMESERGAETGCGLQQ